jgi:hypothetical protein
MTSITLNVPNDAIATQLLAALQNLGLKQETFSDKESERGMSLKEYEDYLFHGDENLKFAEILKMLRKEKKISLRKLEEMTGINYRHISEMENAKRFIGKKNAKRLAKALNADYRYFL